MNKAERIKIKKLIRQRKKRKNKTPNQNPYRSARRERAKQILKSLKIKKGKLEKSRKNEAH